MTKILKFKKEDCLNFRFGGDFVAPVSELIYEESELKEETWIGLKKVGYNTRKISYTGHAILDIPFDVFVNKIDCEHTSSASFRSKRDKGLTFERFMITDVKKYDSSRVLVEFKSSPSV